MVYNKIVDDVEEHKIVMFIYRSIKCFMGFHDYYKWKPYPNTNPDIEVDRCKYCDYYDWRDI